MSDLPRPPTPLVGRKHELAWAKDLLLRQRFVTLFGPGGLGKTHLALALAAQVAEQFTHGVVFVSFEGVTEAHMVVPRLAQALGVSLTADIAPPLALRRHLRMRHLLLVLDCFEQVVGAAPTLASLVEAAAQLSVLVTSRVALNVRGEQLYEVPSLSLPTEGHSLAEVMNAPAVQLFLARARVARPDFALTPANAPALLRLCRQLDGLPLALELAAAQLRERPLEAIALDLDERFERLSLTPDGLRPQPQTMRALLDWSHQSLAPTDRVLFRRLAVFAGGWNVEAATVICAPLPNHDDVWPGLLRLAEQSLIQAHPTDDDVRYRLLDALRVYALDQLATAGETATFQQQHARYFLDLVEQIEPDLIGPRQAEKFNQLAREHDNVRAALHFYLIAEPPQAVRMVAALRRFWLVRGFIAEGRHWLETALAATPAAPMTQARAKALLGAGMFSAAQRDFAQAHACYAAALHDFRALGDKFNAAITLNNWGLTDYATRQYPRARGRFEESFALFTELNDLWGMPMPLINLGLIELAQGHYAEAERHFAESLDLNRAAEDPYGIAFSLDALGGVALNRGDLQRAEALYTEALQVRRELNHIAGLAEALDNLGLIAQFLEQWAVAEQRYTESLNLRRHHQMLWGEGLSWIRFGQLARMQHQWAQAQTAYCASLRLYRKHADDWLAQQALEGLTCAQIAASPAPPPTFAALMTERLSLCEHTRQDLEVARSPHDEAVYQSALAVVRAALSPAAFEAAWNTGQTASLPTAIATRLAEQESAHA
jgi:predicted ATPase